MADAISHPIFDLPKKQISFAKLRDYYIHLKDLTIHSFTSLNLEMKSQPHLALPIVFSFMMDKYNLLPTLQEDLEILERFCFKIEEGYNDCPYHNSCHAADVLWNLSCYIDKCDLVSALNLTKLDLFGLCVSAICHDYMHPGTNNAFIINAKMDLAFEYNDVSVLENMHASKSLSLTRDPKYNIWQRFITNDQKMMRKLMIAIILGSDNAKHEILINTVKQIKTQLPFIAQQKQDILNLLFHSCDIGHVCKDYEITYEWASRVYKEFYLQGLKEEALGIPVTNKCTDKMNPKIQATFLQSFYMPTLDALELVIPTIGFAKAQVQSNIQQLLS
jgi:3'5'-cyclic nucleotide phosphodiesterase